jgi:hypothetical protein
MNEDSTKQDKQNEVDNLIQKTRVQVEASSAYWEVNANYPNNWTLQKEYYKLGKSCMHDKSGINIYGWVSEETYGENKGKIKASHPTYFDEETGSDAIDLGYFDKIEEAMEAVINSNHPDYGAHC